MLAGRVGRNSLPNLLVFLRSFFDGDTANDLTPRRNDDSLKYQPSDQNYAEIREKSPDRMQARALTQA